jgi:hypothetical protein
VAAAVPPHAEKEIRKYLNSFFRKNIHPVVERILGLGAGVFEEELVLESDPEGQKQPFLEAVLPPRAILATRLERPFSTKLGRTFERVARILAAHSHGEARTQVTVEGDVPSFGIARIDQLIGMWKANKENKPSYSDMVREVVAIRDESMRRMRVKVDLYVKHRNGIEYFFEMKSPKPNKDQALASMDKMLRVHLVRRSAEIRTYYVMPFNPYGTREAYGYSVAKTYLDMENFVLIQEEFWDGVIGEPGAFQHIVRLYQEAGAAVRERIDRELFG